MVAIFTDELARIGIEQEFIRVEAAAVFGAVLPIGAVAIQQAGADAGQARVERYVDGRLFADIVLRANADEAQVAYGHVAHTIETAADGRSVSFELRPEALWPLDAARGASSSTAAPVVSQPLPLQATLGQCQSAAREVSDQLCSLFFTHSGEARYSVGA